ncbi:MAG: prevent-host-death protein [Aulosira sp. ZfuVER01]|nr:prevent-host-death protein [Aulosira sp. ZfuVER01]MDZ7999486.1 prevent-host-death protein [Aulosira sp. DedVER01a]MDZ8054734.1 prevent-host-death protein [Aulosira sp. ZfuCHP01]
MQSYPLKEISDRQSEVFGNASVEPVLLTEDSEPSYIIMSARNYQQLVQRLAELEDYVFGKLAEADLLNSQMVGTETFTAELKHLANFESDEQSNGKA